MKKIKLSLVVPFYNEEKIIRKTLFVLNSYLRKKYPDSYELIFVNDGSKDRSLEVLKEDIKKFPRARIISYTKNHGRGYAVTVGFKSARGKIVGFIDSDLEIHQKYIAECVGKIKTNDIAVISKYVKGSRVKTTLLRKITSKIFNLWVGLVLDPDLADHQGGLKLARAEVIRKILPKIKSEGWLFDLEFLYYAKKLGFQVAKVPVAITYGFRRVRASLGFDFLKSLILVFKLRSNKWSLLILPVFLALAVSAYLNFPKTFFQQDEWQFFGADIFALRSANPVANILLPFGGQLTHFYPLSNLALLLEYVLFKTDFAPYAFVALSLHLVNTSLVYYLLNKVIKNSLISFFSAALFLVNGIAHQAVTWVLISVANLPATTLLLMALIFFYKFFENRGERFFILSLMCLVISLLFKEISIFLFVFFGICLLVLRFSRKYLFLLAGSGGVYVLIRLFFLFSGVRSAQPEVGDVSATLPLIYVQRLFLVPLKGLAQTFLPQRLLIKLSEIWTTNETLAQTVVFNKVCYVISVAIIAIFVLFAIRLKKDREIRSTGIIFLSLIFLLTSFLPFVFIPGKAGYFSIFEPRNLYVAVVASSFLITLFASKVLPRTLFFAVMASLIIVNIAKVNADLISLEEVGSVRRSLLESVKKDYPVLPTKVIIYTKSDRSYYGLPENEKILPIQSGFGRMVMVWYQDRMRFPGCLYKDQFLHDLISQGYKYCDGYGFGYFRDYAKLAGIVKKEKFPVANIIAFNWDGNTNKFTNITDEVRNLIKNKVVKNER